MEYTKAFQNNTPFNIAVPLPLPWKTLQRALVALLTRWPDLGMKASSLCLLQESLRCRWRRDVREGAWKSSICNKSCKEPGQGLKTSWNNSSRTWITEVSGREFLLGKTSMTSHFSYFTEILEWQCRFLMFPVKVSPEKNSYLNRAKQTPLEGCLPPLSLQGPWGTKLLVEVLHLDAFNQILNYFDFGIWRKWLKCWT